MAKKAQSVLAVMSMAEISKLSQSDAVNLFVEKTTTVSRAYMDSAKLIIHLRTTFSKSQTVHGTLGKKGVATSTINNAMQAVRVWDELVTAKLVTEEQFDTISYPRFVLINAAIKAKKVEVVGPLVASGNFDEVEFIAENKITTAEHKVKPAVPVPATVTTPVVTATKPPEKKPEAAPEKKPEAVPEKTPEGEKITHLTQPEPEKVTTLKTEQPKVSNIIQMPRKAATLADGEALLDSLQNIFADLPPADFITLSHKLVVLADTVVEQESAIRSKLQKVG